MYFTFLLLCSAFAWAPVSSMSNQLEICMVLRDPVAMDCCTSIKFSPNMMATENECLRENPLTIPHAGSSCALDICIGQKLGYSDDRGRINRTALEAVIRAEYEPANVQTLNDFCIYDSLLDYGDADCELELLRRCNEIELMANCIAWDEDPRCLSIQAVADQCRGKIILPSS